MDMGSLWGTILRTILNYKRDPYVHCQGSFKRANIRSPNWGGTYQRGYKAELGLKKEFQA